VIVTSHCDCHVPLASTVIITSPPEQFSRRGVLISHVPPCDYHVGVFGQVDPAVVESSRRVPNDSILSNDSYVQTIVSYQTIVIGVRAPIEPAWQCAS
jgi:hypothetical protein